MKPVDGNNRPMLRLEGLEVRLSDAAVVHDVTLDIERGELLCLLGPSGCGKTTTLRAIAGFEVPQRGLVEIAGETVSGQGRFVPPQKRQVGFLFQDYALFPHLTVAANIGYGLSSVRQVARRQRVDEMLRQTRMSEHAEKYPHMLSGGQQQRVALARALAPGPRLMLLDEPFSGLDASLRSRIRDETLALLKSAGVTTVMVTHDPGEAMLTADRIALMRDGRIVQQGTPQALYEHPESAFAASFLGDVNHLEGVASNGSVETAVGCFPGERFADGAAVDVYFRPEAISSASHHETQPTRLKVCDIRYVGASSVVQLGLDAPLGHGHIEARLPRNLGWQVGDEVGIRIDRQHTYLFEKGGEHR